MCGAMSWNWRSLFSTEARPPPTEDRIGAGDGNRTHRGCPAALSRHSPVRTQLPERMSTDLAVSAVPESLSHVRIPLLRIA